MFRIPAQHHISCVVNIGTLKEPFPKQRQAAIGGRTVMRGAVRSLRERLTTAERQLSDLHSWRNSMASALPAIPVAEAKALDDDILPNWTTVDAAFPCVSNIREKCHLVTIGYPEHPRAWCTKCGWQFGLSDVAHPVLSLPVCLKSVCGRCLRYEKEAAKALAKSRVREVGVGSH